MTDDPAFHKETLETVDGETYWRRRASIAAADLDRLGEKLWDQAVELAHRTAALKTAREALEKISDNGGDTLTIEDAVRISDAALAAMEPKP